MRSAHGRGDARSRPTPGVLMHISPLEGALNADSVLAARWRIIAGGGEEMCAGRPDYERLVAAQSRLSVCAQLRDRRAAASDALRAVK